MIRVPRYYQVDADDAVAKEYAGGIQRTAVSLATGLGKSTVAAMAALRQREETGADVLLLAHRGELLDQLTDALCSFGVTRRDVGRIQAEQDDRGRPFTVAMTQTLRSERRRARIRRTPGFLVLDEAHRATSPSNMAIFGWAGCFDPSSGARALGLSATLVRGDGAKLGDVWQSVAINRDIAWGVANGPDGRCTGDEIGFLVQPHGKAVVIESMDLEHARTKGTPDGTDYTDTDLGEMVIQGCDEIVRAWKREAGDRLTVVFTPTVASATELAATFVAAGVPTGLVIGETSRKARGDAERGTGLYGDLAHGRIKVLVSVMVTTEGWDCPPVSCVMIARPTRLEGLFTQMVGRGLRPALASRWPGLRGVDKRDCLVLDVVGASRHNRLVTLPDISPSAPYDDSELPEPICFRCKFVQSECVCPEESPERDPDGGRRRLEGPATYEDVDLFASSRLTWLFTHAGHRFIPVGDQLAVIWPDEDENGDPLGTWSAGHCNAKGRRAGTWFGDGLTLEEAFVRAEDYVRRHPGFGTLGGDRKSAWRSGQRAPSVAQLNHARKVGVPSPENYTKGALADLISIQYASRRLDLYG